jgi:hypothetical protein
MAKPLVGISAKANIRVRNTKPRKRGRSQNTGTITLKMDI